MNLIVRKSRLYGTIDIPGSKSHTIRAVAIAALAGGESRIEEPLLSNDAEAAVRVYSALGATIECEPRVWHIRGFGGEPAAPASIIDVGNSGTTLNIAMGTCALLRRGSVVLTGDAQIQRRPAGPLAQSLVDLGANARALNGNDCAPFEISGRLKGGETSLEGTTSQFLSSLLMATPLADGDSVIRLTLLNEKPYVGMTLDWLRRQEIRLEFDDAYTEFRVLGGQRFKPISGRIPADFSSATFFLAAGALGDNEVSCRGLDMKDTQGDKAVVEYLKQMGADVDVFEGEIRVRGNGLQGCDLDLNATPDALPMMAVMGCFAEGTTRLINVPQARIKETDRIAVMREELERMGARIRELPDGLVIERSELRGARVSSHDDHRVAMALAVAATATEGDTVIEDAEAAAVTYPGFARDLGQLGGSVSTVS